MVHTRNAVLVIHHFDPVGIIPGQGMVVPSKFVQFLRKATTPVILFKIRHIISSLDKQGLTDVFK